MKYTDFEYIMTAPRMSRYLTACNGNSRKAMTLYRKNLQISQQLFTVISCFEVALRNAIDKELGLKFGNDWLKDAILSNGIFDNKACSLTKKNINEAILKLHIYNHNKLVAELGFGFWRFMFAKSQFNATDKILLRVFPSKPKTTLAIQYNNVYIFNQLAELNKIRNRIAHHEPICFVAGKAIKSSMYIREHYSLILQLFQWMQIDESSLLYGIDRVNIICNDIDNL